MRSLPLLLCLTLLCACPKKDPATSGDAQPQPTPRAEQPDKDDPADASDAPPADAAQRVLTAVVLRAEGSEAAPPAGLEVLQGEGGVLLVRGNPRALPTRGDWSTAAVLGDPSAAAKVADLPGLMATLAAGTDPLAGTVTLADDAPGDARAQLEGLRITVDSANEGVLAVQVLASKLDTLLGVQWVQSFELAE